MERKKPGRKVEPASKRRIRWPRWTGFGNKTVWEWLQLLIVPLALAAIGFWFTAQQDARQQRIENQRAQSDRQIEEQRAQDAALQAYLDQMSQLLLEKDLRDSEEGSEVSTLARARTLTVLSRLNADRRSSVMQFLMEASLVQVDYVSNKTEPVISLAEADLSSTDLRNAELRRAYLSGANLRDADLFFADLTEADLRGTDLRGANLKGADLSGARGVTNEQLEQQAASLKGATMPDGSKHP